MRSTLVPLLTACLLATLVAPRTAPAEDLVVVEGTVVNAEGDAPVAGVRICVYGYAGDNLRADVTSDARGAFRVSLRRAEMDEPILATSHPDFGPTVADVDRRTLRLRLRPGRLLQGRVLDEHEKPVADARVVGSPTLEQWAGEAGAARNHVWSYAVSARSAADGTFSIRAPASNDVALLLGAIKPGIACRWTLATATLATKPASPVLLRTLPSVALSGRTVGADGSPVPRAKVWPRHAFGTWVHPWMHEIDAPSVASDAEGRYELTDLPPVGNTIYTKDPDRAWGSRSAWVSAQKPGTRLEGQDLVVRDYVPLACKVVDGDTKLAWKVRVAAVPAGDTTLANAVYGQPDPEGRVVFAAATQGPFDIVRVLPTGWHVLKRGVMGPVRDLELALGEASNTAAFIPLRVRVEPPDGQPAEGRHVRVSMASDGVRRTGLAVSGTTDEEGVATIEVPFLPPWGVSVSEAARSGMIRSGIWFTHVSTLPDQGVLRATLGLRDRATGRVTYADGRGVGGARVRSLFVDPDPEAWAATDEDGEFRLGFANDDPPLDGGQTLEIELPGDARRILSLDLHDPDGPWWVLRLPPLGTLEGRLQAPDGVALPAGEALRIAWSPKEQEAWVRQVVRANVDAGGAFSVADLPTDRDLDVEVLPDYAQAAHAHSVERSTRTRIGSSPTTIEMVAVAPIAGRVVGRPAGGEAWHVALRPARGVATPVRARLSASGTFEAWPLAPGEQVVQLIAEREGIRMVVDRARAEPGNKGVLLQAPDLLDTTLVFEEAYGPAFITVSDPVTHAVLCAQESPEYVEGQLVLALPKGEQLDVTVQFLEAQSYVARRLKQAPRSSRRPSTHPLHVPARLQREARARGHLPVCRVGAGRLVAARQRRGHLLVDRAVRNV
ncbi:MAG: hypothetical protein R3F05_00350 [Planctomycetota bacterium]